MVRRATGRPGPRGGARGHPGQAGGDQRPVLPGPGVRHGRPARRPRRRHQPHERLHRAAGDARPCQLPEKAGGQPFRRHRLRQPHQVRPVRKTGRRRAGRERRAGAHLPVAFADADPLVGRAVPALRRGHLRDGQPQPRQVQRVQSLRARRLPDHPEDGGRRPRRNRAGGHFRRREAHGV